jgi:hypothetical protein
MDIEILFLKVLLSLGNYKIDTINNATDVYYESL